MVLALLNSLICCCRHRQQDDDDVYNEHDTENSRLIPDDLEPSMYSNQAFIDHQNIQRRLDTIVRAKEGKMVNVNSQIPFNLHNQVIPPENHHTISRSTSGSFDFYNHSNSDFSRPVQYQLPDPSNSYTRFSVSHSYDDVAHASWSRSGSRERGRDTKTNPILNVRLVGFVDRRGRSGQRTSDSNLDVGSDGTVRTSHMPSTRPGDSTGSDTLSSHALSLAAKLKQQESNALSMSWGD
ncbi:hypothetical protein BDZ94DRAFT_1258274 [Collybia nuda]|uniref:Uncharacterized protein n=1 Tax=Collybia nuda TaxID=64659 RepID=A0A9P5Y7H4_9AGAR|nr:hypothetical protein BDZ94DRAFT_1258274 [Collybia nuda]